MKRHYNAHDDETGTEVGSIPSPAKKHRQKAENLTPSEPAADGTIAAATKPVFEQVTKEAFVGKFAVNLPGADVYYQPDTVDSETANTWFKELNRLDTSYATTPSLTVKYSNHDVMVHYPYPSLLQEIQAEVEKTLGVTFNHVMLNRYEDGTIYIGKHSDTAENKVIASLSLGAVRTFIMSPRKGFTVEKKSWPLANGSLLVMQGDTQKNWHHEIPKESKRTVKAGRISLTFRQLISS
ncbi:hypothetical protein FRB97_006449 [Tulasnella sp. 331]|nr:hypothetical protein FRB97_006449 [Tulasnella sp. 331]